MPLFINFQNVNELIQDDEGIDLPSLEAARQVALISAREILADNIKAGVKDALVAITISNESGQELMTIPSADLLPAG